MKRSVSVSRWDRADDDGGGGGGDDVCWASAVKNGLDRRAQSAVMTRTALVLIAGTGLCRWADMSNVIVAMLRCFD